MPKDQLGVHVSATPKAPGAEKIKGRNLTPGEMARFELQDEIDRILEQNDRDHDQEKLILLLMQQQKFMNQTIITMQGNITNLQTTVSWLRDRVIWLCAASAGGGYGLSKGLGWLFGG